MPDLRHRPGGMQREARQRASLAKMALYYNAHLAFALFGRKGPHYKERFVLHGSVLTALTPWRWFP